MALSQSRKDFVLSAACVVAMIGAIAMFIVILAIGWSPPVWVFLPFVAYYMCIVVLIERRAREERSQGRKIQQPHCLTRSCIQQENGDQHVKDTAQQ